VRCARLVRWRLSALPARNRVDAPAGPPPCYRLRGREPGRDARRRELPGRSVRPAGPLPRPGGWPRGLRRRRLRGDVARHSAAAPARARGPQRPRTGGAGAAVRLVPPRAAPTAAGGAAAGNAVGAV
ncbi:MAG: hypothetical protein AVDCRST_MAG08-2813, partial [uncultured Acetobacteraceae bacterium]